MGQAKKRGTFEERKAAAEELANEKHKLQTEMQRRRPSPKHLALMASVFGLATNVGTKGHIDY